MHYSSINPVPLIIETGAAVRSVVHYSLIRLKACVLLICFNAFKFCSTLGFIFLSYENRFPEHRNTDTGHVAVIVVGRDFK